VVPTITLGGVGNQTVEAGSTFSPSITLTGDKNDAGAYSQLRILRGGIPLLTDTTLTPSLITNVPDQFGFSNPNNPNTRYSISPTPYSESYLIPSGTTSSTIYKGDGNYGAGLAIKDNKGADDTRTPAVRSANAPQAASVLFESTLYVVNGIYPYFYGDMGLLPTPALIASAIQAGTFSTKVLSSASGTVATPYNVTGRYIWVAYLSSFTSKTIWWVTDFDSSDIDGSYITTAVTQAVNSPDGYWTGINFKMHWSVYDTTQTSGTFEYRNS